MAKWTYEGTKRGYAAMWVKLVVDPKEAKKVDTFAKKILAGKDRYQEVEALTGVPWFFIGALHMRESGCDFAGVLHNGEKIIGKNKKTKLVPAGRGPFKTWEEAAVDALKIKGLDKITDWNISRMGFEAERFNGLGYAARGVNSPYVWASSNYEQTGKYVRDHVWDKNFDDPQVGVLTVLKRLSQMDNEVAVAIDNHENEPKKVLSVVEAEMIAANVEVPMKDSQIAKAAAVGGTTITAGSIATSAWDALKDAPESLLAFVITMAKQPPFWIAIAVAVVCWYILNKRKSMRA